MIGVYCIVNLVNHKKYFGQSMDIKNRIMNHKCGLKGGYHHNGHLQSAYNKYGEKSFMFCVIVECSANKLDYYENKFINEFDTMNPIKGYNLDSGGNLNKYYSDEALIKRSGKNHPKWGTSVFEERGGIPFIKSEISKGKTKKEIAMEAGVASSSLDSYLKSRNYSWKDLGGTPIGKHLKGSLFDKIGGIPFIKSEICKGKSQRQIERESGASHKTLGSYIKRRGYTWTELKEEALWKRGGDINVSTMETI